MPNHSTEQILSWIRFDSTNMIEAMKDDLMPDSTGISQLLKENADRIKEVCIHYNKRNPINTRFYVSCVKIKHLQNFMFHVKDIERIGKSVELDISVTQSDLLSFGMLQWKESSQEMNKRRIMK